MNETNEKKNVGKSTGTSGRYRKTPAKKTAEAKTTVETKRASEKPAAQRTVQKRTGTAAAAKTRSYTPRKNTGARNKKPLKIIPLGGLGERGKNITLYEYDGDMFLVDCGMSFPDEETPGIDIVIPDFTYVHENKDKIIRRINTNLVKKAHRCPQIIYYDVTNFYFEIEDPDEDILDEDGTVLEKGMRKMGVCKEERKLPILQMGLFMDDSGIPIAVESFPGNTLDHLTLRPALKKQINDLDFARFILIADRGICNYRNLLHVLDAGNGYIVSKSLLKSTKAEQAWAYAEDDFTKLSEDFKYKSRIIKHTKTDENGQKRTVEEKVVVYWSRKFQARCERENKRFLEFLKKLEESPQNFRITALQAKSLRKFLKKEYVNQKTGEIVNASDMKAFLDFDRIAEYKKSMGYYQIVTSELTMDAQEVIEKYHGLTQIEDQFRVMKSDLETRPFYVHTPEHMQAHILICMISLIMLRLIQKRILHSKLVDMDEQAFWNTGLSCERIQQALNKWKVDLMPADLYRFMDVDDPDLKLILDAFDIEIPLKLYRKAELKALKKKIKIFM